MKSLQIRCSYFIRGNCDFFEVFVIKVELLSAKRSNWFVFMCRRRRGFPTGRDFYQSSAPNVLRSVNPHPACSHLVSFGTKRFRGTKFLRFRLSTMTVSARFTSTTTTPVTRLRQAWTRPPAKAPWRLHTSRRGTVPFRKPFRYQSNPWLALGFQPLRAASDSREKLLRSEFRSARLVMHSSSTGNLAVGAVG